MLEMDMHVIEDASLLQEVEDLRLERHLEAPRHAEMKDAGVSQAERSTKPRYGEGLDA